MNWIFYVILAALVLSYGLHVFADKLNLRGLNGQRPKSCEHIYGRTRYAKFCAYERVNTYFRWVEDGTKLAILLAFWFLGGFNWLNNLVLGLGWGLIPSGIVFVVVLLWASFFMELPFNYYNTFSIEQKYGFNRTNLKTFVGDRIKFLILITVLAALIFAVLIWFFERNYQLSWLACWVILCVLMFLIQWLVPHYIMPLFNKFSKLPAGNLRSMIENYVAKLGFSIKGIYVMDASKRSSKLNAFVTGFGRSRRIVLYDTLITECEDREVLAILAHEIGHMRLNHLRNGLFVQFTYVGVLLFLLSFFVLSPSLYAAFFMDTQPVYAGILFFMLLYTPIDFFAGIALNYFSRKKEFEADKFAYETANDAPSLIHVFEKLASANLANLKPSWFYVMLNSTHPPLLVRIETIDNLAAGEK